jgi:hypothetical protein
LSVVDVHSHSDQIVDASFDMELQFGVDVGRAIELEEPGEAGNARHAA